MNENEFQAIVVELARRHGWGMTDGAREAFYQEAAAFGIEAPELEGMIYHPLRSRGSMPGWPDLTLVRRKDRRLIFAELKTEKGRLTRHQVEVLDLLSCLTDDSALPMAVGSDQRRRIEVHVWRPGDLKQIEETLR